MAPMYMFSAIRYHLSRTVRLFVTLLVFFSFLPAIAQRLDIRYTLQCDTSRRARAAAVDGQRSFEELKEKF
jgi:hypothetical protein